MHKRMTITLDETETVYEGLYRTVGKRRMSQFIEDLVRPYVMDTALDDGYRAMAADKAREAEALEWCNALAGDMADQIMAADQTRLKSQLGALSKADMLAVEDAIKVHLGLSR